MLVCIFLFNRQSICLTKGFSRIINNGAWTLGLFLCFQLVFVHLLRYINVFVFVFLFVETGKTVVLSVCSGIINNVWLGGESRHAVQVGRCLGMGVKVGQLFTIHNLQLWVSRWANYSQFTIMGVKVGQLFTIHNLLAKSSRLVLRPRLYEVFNICHSLLSACT